MSSFQFTSSLYLRIASSIRELVNAMFLRRSISSFIRCLPLRNDHSCAMNTASSGVMPFTFLDQA